MSRDPLIGEVPDDILATATALANKYATEVWTSEARAEIALAIRAARYRPSLATKPLVWRDTHSEAPIGRYDVMREGLRWAVYLNNWLVAEDIETLERAKVAAQADFDRRVCESIVGFD